MALFETERLIKLDNKLRSLPDVNSGILHFLSIGDLKDAAGACLDMAVIEFCTIYNTGNGDSWIKKNTHGSVDKIRNDIEKKAFPEKDDLSSYEELRELLQTIRSDLIAHRSGKGIGYEQTANGTVTYTKASKTWETMIDRLPELIDSTKKLRKAIHELQLENT